MDSEDFGFYGTNNDGRSEVHVKGVTEDVTDFTFANVEYPCIIFKEGFSVPKHQLNVVSNMVKSCISTKDISLYYSKDSDLYKIGMIDGKQVNAFLEVIGIDKVFGFYDKNTRLEGNLLYTLSTIG